MKKITLLKGENDLAAQSKIIFAFFLLTILTTITPLFCAAQSRSADSSAHWLKIHKAAEFTGQVWARVRVVAPENYFYNVVIDSETNPYLPARIATGTLAKSGLKPKNWKDTGNDWGQPLAWIPPSSDADWLKSGEDSAWVKLPVSTAPQWHTAFIIKSKPGNAEGAVVLRIEFASKPDANSIFHTIEENTDERMTIVARMPTVGGIEGLQMLQSLTEWANSRRETVKSFKLSAPPKLNELKIGTWVNLGTYRTEGGRAPRSRAEIDFQNFSDLGINMVSADGIDDNLFRELAQKYGVVDTTLTAWAQSWAYTGDAAGKYNFLPDETPEQRWTRVFEDYYPKFAANIRMTAPFAASIARHINLGDEIGAATNADEISKTPQILKAFRDWLKAQNVTPAMLDAADWDAVQPTDDRSKLAAGGVGYARRFYYTRRFINEYTAIYYRAATNAAAKSFPNADLITVNYQAGPMQFGFVGNDNDLDKGQLDIFELGRMRAMKGVMMEDWVDGWDLGIGRENLAALMMRAAARKHNLPLAAYLVGGEAVRAEYFGYLMNGVKETGLYLYGPFSNIGPAWGDNKNALEQVADVSRRVKKFEPLIIKAVPRPSKIALLVAATSDAMQANGLYFAPERQNLFVALQHAGVSVEVVSEQDIADENLLKNYSMLIVSDPQVRMDVQRKIADWVKNGGRLWASVGASSLDEFNQPGRALDAVFGVKDTKINFQNGGIKPSQEAWAMTVSKFDYQKIETLKTTGNFFTKQIEIPVLGAKLQTAPTTAAVLANYTDGKPAVFLNKYGKGEAMLVGALVGESYVRAHYPSNLLKDEVLLPDWKFELGAEIPLLATDFIKRAAITNPLALSVPGVYSSVLETPEATLIFLNNATGHAIPNLTVRVRDAGKIRAAESTLADKIAFRAENGEIVFDVPLRDAEIIVLKR